MYKLDQQPKCEKQNKTKYQTKKKQTNKYDNNHGNFMTWNEPLFKKKHIKIYKL